MFANAGPSGEPIATPFVCLYIVSLKLNSTDGVALSLSSINTAWGMGGMEEGRVFEQGFCTYADRFLERYIDK